MSDQSSNRIDAIDGLRGVAVIAIMVFCHYIGQRVVVFDDRTTPLAHGVGVMFKLCGTGVHLFFLLSGFLLARILLQGKEACGTETARGKLHFLRTFFIRRIARIFPLYYANLLAFVLVSSIAGGSFDWLVGEPLPPAVYLTYLQSNVMAAADSFGAEWLAPTWSLSVEEQFYLLLPFFVLFSPARWIPRILAVGIVAGPVLRAVAGITLGGTAAVVLLTSCIDAFSFGVLAAYALHNPKWQHRVRAHCRHCLWLSAVLIAMAVLVSVYGDRLDIGAVIVGGYWLMIAGMTSLLLYITQSGGTRLHRILTCDWLRWIGIRCYAIYLFHQAAIGLLGGLLLGNSGFAIDSLGTIGVALLAVAVTLLLAHVSWLWVERPLIRWGHRFRYTPSGGATVELPAAEPAAVFSAHRAYRRTPRR